VWTRSIGWNKRLLFNEVEIEEFLVNVDTCQYGGLLHCKSRMLFVWRSDVGLKLSSTPLK
ncbi:unnamed protein product, partial [Sphenostylis stenocarpa]